MEPIRIDAKSINLDATWSCFFRDNSSGGYSVWQTEAKATKTVSFEYTLPKNVVIKSAKVHSVWSGSLFGIEKGTVNSVEPDTDGFVLIDVPDPSETLLTVEFGFIARRDDPYDIHGNEISDLMDVGQLDETYTLGTHTSSALVDQIYLLIEYEGGTEYIYHAEGDTLVPYRFYRAESGALVPYNLFGTPGAYVEDDDDTSQFYTVSGEQFFTSDGNTFKVLGG